MKRKDGGGMGGRNSEVSGSFFDRVCYADESGRAQLESPSASQPI